jgi:hypothetical protein
MRDQDVIINYAKQANLANLDTSSFSNIATPHSEENTTEKPDTFTQPVPSTPNGAANCQVFCSININEEALKWRVEFGTVVAEQLETVVRAAMPDYEFLMARKFTAKEA